MTDKEELPLVERNDLAMMRWQAEMLAGVMLWTVDCAAWLSEARVRMYVRPDGSLGSQHLVEWRGDAPADGGLSAARDIERLVEIIGITPERSVDDFEFGVISAMNHIGWAHAGASRMLAGYVPRMSRKGARRWLDGLASSREAEALDAATAPCSSPTAGRRL